MLGGGAYSRKGVAPGSSPRGNWRNEKTTDGKKTCKAKKVLEILRKGGTLY